MRRRTTTASLRKLSTSSLDQIQRQAASGQIADDLRAVLGEAGAREIEQMASAGGDMTLGARPVVVVLAGIAGTTLLNTSDGNLIWLNPLAFIAGKLAQLRLDPTGAYDPQGVTISPSGLLPTHYLLLQMQLRTFGGCDVYPFPFDWRRPPALAAERLRQFVTDLHQKSGSKVHLVGHSMGGLVARAFCASHPDEASAAVAQVIQLGTPNYGAFSSLQSLLTDDGLVGMVNKINPANDALAFTRSCPGIYAMLPAPPEAYPSHAPFAYPFDRQRNLYDYAAYGIDGLNQAHLQAAREFYRSTKPDQALPVPATVIAGYDLPTTVSITINRDQATNSFSFAASGDGDGTVTLASVTALPGATCYYGRGLKHGDLPLYGAVRDAVGELVNGRQPTTLVTQPYAQTLGVEPELTLSVPAAPSLAELDEPTTTAIAKRIRAGKATPSDLRTLALF